VNRYYRYTYHYITLNCANCMRYTDVSWWRSGEGYVMGVGRRTQLLMEHIILYIRTGILVFDVIKIPLDQAPRLVSRTPRRRGIYFYANVLLDLVFIRLSCFLSIVYREVRCPLIQLVICNHIIHIWLSAGHLLCGIININLFNE